VCFYESIPGFHQFSIKDNGPELRRVCKRVFQVFQTIKPEIRERKLLEIGLSIVLR
jgi:signal transduction histidine kinase